MQSSESVLVVLLPLATVKGMDTSLIFEASRMLLKCVSDDASALPLLLPRYAVEKSRVEIEDFH